MYNFGDNTWFGIYNVPCAQHYGDTQDLCDKVQNTFIKGKSV